MGKRLFAIAPALAASLAGCSMKGLALRSTAALLDDGSAAIYDEPDARFAAETLGSQLKLVEGLLRSEPGHSRLLLLAAQGFGGEAFLFLEDSEPERAKLHYLRGRDFALRALARRKSFRGLAAMPLDAAEAALREAGRGDVPALYWAAFDWAGWINLSKDSSAALADLPRVAAIMGRVRELDPDFQFAGPDLFFGVYYASRPAMLGGDVRRAREHFQEARRRTGGKFLMNYVLEAKYLAVASQDRELFTGLLAKARESPAGLLPLSRMIDEVAKRKAAALLEKTDDLF